MLKKALIASAVLASVFSAQAQVTTAGFGVQGTITPTTCNLSLTGGLADYGTLTKTQVQATPDASNPATAYYLGAKLVAMTLQCAAPVKLALSMVDNKAAQRLALDVNDDIRYGIADGAGTTAIGAYAINFANVTVDGSAPAGWLHAPNGTQTWTQTAGASGFANRALPGYTIGFRKVAGSTTPDSVTTLGGTFEIGARVSKAYVDAATSNITLNGAGTMSIVFL